ncbi:hypothetical protein SAMN06297387_10527 [Streptomyces zhaozhouensis]|uniref:SGNH/GDSL hydrolase family protein n=1 Tax=Streptomyces zhaozhouensis TaxID=1300267 RepID=A0A286DU69_9ACTN|nr:SGNH/GDSL hydrolase family protein [Streptomyces zhaozhouensis]SOD62212.1 hypothetical protein SAMN06297387_10527 [Streptomyces zhaozhouensis]
MHLEPAHRADTRRPPRSRRRTRVGVALTTALAGVLLAACGSGEGDDERERASSAPGKEGADLRLLWLGDSVAGVQAPALEAAMDASGVTFEDLSSTGGGTVVASDEVAELADATWESLRSRVDSFAPDVIAYQLTTYDWGTPEQQRDAYTRLATTARDAGAALLLVTAPPVTVDEFLAPHAEEMATAPESAEAVAAAAESGVHFLDAADLWGTDPEAGAAMRSADGIHSCQQGAAAFATWFGERLGALHDTTPAAPEEWATGSWTADERFSQLGCE